LLLLLAVGIAACGSPSDAGVDATRDAVNEPPRPSELVLAVGQEVSVAGTNLRVRFDAVRSDSRCPINAICIHAGDAEVELSLTVGSRKTSHVLHWAAGPNRPGSAVAGDYRVSLMMLDPMPHSETGAPARDAYRAHLKVERI
jgi:hypothetical protein